MGFPEAFRWAREHGIRVVATDDQMEWLDFQLQREGIELKPGWTADDAFDALDKPRND